MAREGFLEFGARAYYSMYNGLDPETHYPVPRRSRLALRCGVSRQPPAGPRGPRGGAVSACRRARARRSSFLLGGEGWGDKPMPPNVRYIGHVPTADHNRVNCSAGMVLNINRASMADFGFSPPNARLRGCRRGHVHAVRRLAGHRRLL